MASPRKSERLIFSRGHGCFTISPPQLPATATRFPSHGSGRPGLVLRTATKLSSVGFEPTAVLTFGLRVRRLSHSSTRSPNVCLSNLQNGFLCKPSSLHLSITFIQHLSSIFSLILISFQYQLNNDSTLN